MKEFLRTHKYVLLILYIPFYLLWFAILEKAVVGTYWVSYLPLDDIIPFLPGFVFPYCTWYLFLLLPGLYWLFTDVPAYKRYMCFFIAGFTICLLICTLFPNGQNLRPVGLTPDTLSKRLILAIYAADTNTNVLPSMHIVGSFAVVYGAVHSRRTGKPHHLIPMIILALLICASTVLIKQHSVLDIFVGVAVCIPIWLLLDLCFRKHSASLKR